MCAVGARTHHTSHHHARTKHQSRHTAVTQDGCVCVYDFGGGLSTTNTLSVHHYVVIMLVYINTHTYVLLTAGNTYVRTGADVIDSNDFM